MDDFKLNTAAIKQLSPEILQLVYNEAKERLSDLRVQESATTERAYKLLALFITLATATIGYLYLHWQPMEAPIIALMLFGIGLLFAIGFMLAVIRPRYYMPKGRKPSDYHLAEWAETMNGKELRDEGKMMVLLAKELTLLEQSIQTQTHYNRKRTLLFTLSLASCILGFIVSAVFFICLQHS